MLRKSIHWLFIDPRSDPYWLALALGLIVALVAIVGAAAGSV